jgi:mono/diheme cytochrome c family protein
MVSEGRLLARIHCSACHAIDPGETSAHLDAPSLRLISRRYPVSALEESLAEGIVVGHPDMPEYRFRPEDVASLLAFLETIQD